MTQFIRQAKVLVGIRKQNSNQIEQVINIEGLRVSFDIQKNLSYAPNLGIIKIWNLSPEHRNIIKDFGDQVTLFTGYERGSGYSILFTGDTTSVAHFFDLPDVVTILECGDGDRFVNNIRQSLSFAPGTPVSTVIKQISQALGLNLTQFTEIPDTVYPLGFESCYLLKEALTKACESSNLQWSVQNGELQIIPISGNLNQSPYLIDADSGMIGIPQRFTWKRQDTFEQGNTYGPPVGWKVSTLLTSRLLPGSPVIIKSDYLGINQLCIVQTIRHTGDTFGLDWSSTLEVIQK